MIRLNQKTTHEKNIGPKQAIEMGCRQAASDRGSVLVLALLALLAVTIFGIASLNTSSVELHIARNERTAREVFYLAEGAAMEGIQRLIDADPLDLEEKVLIWHHGVKDLDSLKTDFRDPEDWILDTESEDNARQSAVNPDTHIAAVEYEVATGASLVMTETRLYVNRIYGLCRKYSAQEIVEVGYRLRY